MTGVEVEVKGCSLEQASQILHVPAERVVELVDEGRISGDPQDSSSFSRQQLLELRQTSLSCPEALLRNPCSFDDALKQLHLAEEELKLLVSQGEIPCYRVSQEYSPHGRIFEQADIDHLEQEWSLTASPTESLENPYAALSFPPPPRVPWLIDPRATRDREDREDDPQIVA